MVTLTCGDSSHRTGECKVSRRPCVTNPKKPFSQEQQRNKKGSCPGCGCTQELLIVRASQTNTGHCGCGSVLPDWVSRLQGPQA